MSNLLPRTFEAFRVGEPIPPISYVLEEEDVRRHRFAVDDHTDWGATPGGPGDFPEGALTVSIAAPTVLGMDAIRLLRSRYGGGPALHARQAFRFQAPVPVGARIVVSGEIVEKYERRGRRFIALETESRDDQGRLLVWGRYVLAVFRAWGEIGPGRASPLARTESEPRPAPDRQVRKVLAREQVMAFSGPEANIHTDLAHARAAGLPGLIAQGLMCADWTSELMGRDDPARWQTAGALSLAFLRAPVPGHAVVVRAWRASGTGFNVQCLDEADDALLAVGEASLGVTD